MKRRLRSGLQLALAAHLAACATAPPDAMREPLAATGDAGRGRVVFADRGAGHCVLCHAVPGIAPAGNLGPSLAGVGARLSVPQLRLRVVDITRVRPDAAMPSFHRSTGLARVAAAHVDKPILSAQAVEDVVAYLATLR